MIAVDKFIDDLVYITAKRNTHYNNHAPYNCGYIYTDGSISFDCIGLVKSYINDPTIAHRFNPAGFYVVPGQVIPDTSEKGILDLCTEVVWNDFSSAIPGEYMYMDGHAGVYVGDAFGKLSNVNVIECTLGWGADGVVASWVDSDGTRRDMKRGTVSGKWEAHGKLTDYITYSLWYQKDGKWYCNVPEGWYYDETYKSWFLIGDGGEMLTGWHYVNGKWYYMCPKNDGVHCTGAMITGKYNVPCTFAEDGHWIG